MKICGLKLNWYPEFFWGISTQNIWKLADSDIFHASLGEYRVFSSVLAFRFDYLLRPIPFHCRSLGISYPFRLAV